MADWRENHREYLLSTARSLSIPVEQFRTVADEVGAALIDSIRQAFGNLTPWWPEPQRDLPYWGRRLPEDQSFRLITQVVPDPSEPVWFVAFSYGEKGIVFESMPSVVERLLGETHLFEYAVVPKRLYVKDFQALRQVATEACLEQREFLDLVRNHEREKPYPLPTVMATRRERERSRYAGQTTDMTGLKYTAFGQSQFARTQPHRQTHAFRHAPRGRPLSKLSTCTCPRCNAVHIHNARDPVHRCACGLLLHRNKALSLQKSRGKELSRAL